MKIIHSYRVFITIKNAKHLLKQIAKRGQDYEKTIDTDYLLSIQSGYFQFFKEHPELSVLLLDVDDMDYVNDKKVFN